MCSPILATLWPRVPPLPAVVSPRRGAHDVEEIPQVLLTVLGGVRGGSVHAQVQGTSIDVSLPFDANGSLVSGAVPVGSYGAQTLLLSQRTRARGATCGSTQPWCLRREHTSRVGRRRRRTNAGIAGAAGDLGTARSHVQPGPGRERLSG